MMSSVNVAGYHLREQLYNGQRTVVYRGVRKTDSLPVVIKLLKNPYPSFSELTQFRNQYIIAKNLNYPGIIKTYSLTDSQNGYALVMEDFGGISLKDYFASKNDATSLHEFLQIAIALSNTLDFLILHGILHKDIKPGNILINPETKQVKLIDFSIASLLPRETQTLISPSVLEGTLAYISPEQTGRMNRGIDYRTDFYSLGITFYELLTKELPFQSEDAMELVHCHIAKTAPLVHEINSAVPFVISKIVSKLMAKNASDRYQSALGLKYDLEKCLVYLKETGKITDFPIAQRDVCSRFIIPDKLYGREDKVEILLQAFERVSLGASEMILVAGFSGIGKTVVVNEIHKPIVRQRGYFIKGKYDQFGRNIPFSAFVQAFRDLMRQLLSESDAELAAWQAKILTAVGENGQVIIDVIPELERIIGQQPSPQEISSSAAQNRFNLLFQKFIQVFTTPEHPLVMFLDDLQWADSASLNLLKVLMTEARSGYLLILGAYRDHEVSPAHPLMLTLSQIHKSQATVNTMTLEPLEEITINQLVADTLSCTKELARPLTQWVYLKTKGNPFFTTQFLKALHEEGWIQFQPELGYWQCDMISVRQLALSDDVLEFMNLQLVKLPVETQEVLKLAACIGNQFDLKTLVTVSGKSLIDTATNLWKALQEGLILPVSETYKFFQSNDLDNIDRADEVTIPYKFLHDRVQQAAHSLIPEEQKQTTHFQIGQLLLKETSSAERQEKLFEIVGQLNIGKGLISEQQERDTLAQLNWEAGEKAKAATAYTTALDFFSVGIDLLAVNGWESQYELSLVLHSSAAEVAYLSGDFERMEQLIQIVLKHAKTLLDQIQVYQTQIQAYQSQDQLLQAIETALSVLKLLDIHFPEQPSFSDIQTALDEVSNSLSEISIENLIDLPCMIDPHKLAAIRILVSVTPCVKQSVPTLLPLIVQKMISLSLQNGNAAESAFAYAVYGSVLCITGGNIDAGYQFAQLGLNLLQRFTTREFQSRTYVVANFLVVHWKDHVRKTLHPLLEAYQSGLETGDLEHAAWSATFYCSHAYFVGHSLPELESEIVSYSEMIRQSKQQSALNTFSVFEQVVLTWLGKRPVLHSLNDNNDYLEDLLQLVLRTNNRYALAAIHINQMILFYGFGDYKQASIHASVAREYLMAVAGGVLFNIFHVYEALTDLAIYSNVDPKQQSQILEKVKVNQATLKQWTDFAPENNLHRFELVEAELHRVLGLKSEALQGYERAIAIAKANGYIQDEALSNELAAKFYLDWGKEKIAAGYMQEAYYCYARWGAKAKIIHLEQQYPQLLAGILQAPNVPITHEGTVAPTLMRSFSNLNSSQNLWLDFPAVMKAAQAISQEMELEKLLATLIQTAITSAGAQIGRLLLLQDEQWLVVAQADSKQTQRLEILMEQCREIPKRVIYAVARTQETAVFENLSDSTEFAGDHYIITHQPKSVLCTPISQQGKLIGILYLENNLTVGAFTSDHLQIIQLLTAQAAISLENAQLYCQLEEYSHSLEQKVSERTQELTQKATQLQSALQELKHTQAQLVQAEKMSSLGQLVAGIAHEINNPINFIYANIEPANEYVKSLIELNDLYQKYYPQPVAEIQEKIIDMEVDFLVNDLQKLLESMKIGAKRIQKIVLSLRNFSRLDEAEIKDVDLHEGIDSTLLILQHRFKNSSKNTEIAIIKSYGKIPLVNCYPSALNQVFMNILSNAIDALHQVEINHEPTITICTEVQEEKYVVIRIIDNGIGMTETVQNKIFEPFFTTKPVGSGTGLGLSISYSVVAEQHGGQLSCISTPGKGTEFVIQIPL